MKTIHFINRSVIAVILLGAIMTLAGCAAKKNTWGDPKTGVILEYRMPDTDKLQYDLTSDYVQGMEVMGQKVDLTSNSRNVFTMEAKGMENGNHKLNVTIDTVYIHIQSPRGEIVPDMGGVIGKSFDLMVSPKGKELDYSGAESLKYVLGMSEELSIASDFQAVFPNLPDKPIKVGESWNSVDTLVEKSGSGYLQIITYSENMVEGIETFKGYDCVKIHSTFAGTLEGSGDMQGIKTQTTGTIEGKDTWYFAFKKGLFLKMTSEGKAISTTKTTGEREMTIPGTRDFAIVTELIR